MDPRAGIRFLETHPPTRRLRLEPSLRHRRTSLRRRPLRGHRQRHAGHGPRCYKTMEGVAAAFGGRLRIPGRAETARRAHPTSGQRGVLVRRVPLGGKAELQTRPLSGAGQSPPRALGLRTGCAPGSARILGATGSAPMSLRDPVPTSRIQRAYAHQPGRKALTLLVRDYDYGGR